jgi:tetratricopeptide (TPR) repeat protein
MELANIRNLFERAAHFAGSGQYRKAAKAYERVVKEARSTDSPLQLSDLDQFLRSVNFNLAQVLNKLKEFRKALSLIDEDSASHSQISAAPSPCPRRVKRYADSGVWRKG